MDEEEYRKCPLNGFKKCREDCMLFWETDEDTVDRCTFAKIAYNLQEIRDKLDKIR